MQRSAHSALDVCKPDTGHVLHAFLIKSERSNFDIAHVPVNNVGLIISVTNEFDVFLLGFSQGIRAPSSWNNSTLR
jgi:hypothetical protein